MNRKERRAQKAKARTALAKARKESQRPKSWMPTWLRDILDIWFTSGSWLN